MPPIDTSSDGLQRLGTRLRNLRRLRSLSLGEAAAAVGLSSSFLSMVERGESDLAMSRFTRLADFYGVQPSELLLEEGSYDPPAISEITAAKAIDRGRGVEYYLVREIHPQLIFVSLQPKSSFKDLRAHAGEDVWVVCDGAVELLYGDRSYSLAGGQTARFHGGVPHGISNPHRARARLLALCTVPYW